MMNGWVRNKRKSKRLSMFSKPPMAVWMSEGATLVLGQQLNVSVCMSPCGKSFFFPARSLVEADDGWSWILDIIYLSVWDLLR